MSISGPFIDQLFLSNQPGIAPLSNPVEVLANVQRNVDEVNNVRDFRGGRRASDRFPFGFRPQTNDTQPLLDAGINDILLREQQVTQNRIENARLEEQRFAESQIEVTINVIDSLLGSTTPANSNESLFTDVNNDVINSFLVQALSILIQADAPRERDISIRTLQQSGPREGSGINTNINQRNFAQPFIPEPVDFEA